ncbi:LysR substrate-binding domain-containing protein [Bradyrhizobium quebecense]|jgi:DNA-binding transcriptional LysR family regulator|uniref:LysR family transcriptional regulator n=3 Tax=Bradyrhizobium TaxID=374 RepID=A0A973WUA3_9BRAD|nr:LysR substrate-binding domain-containing protein [Bradyrhizobium quebecense]UGA44709.1 LysR family transcriptional regulator [Bradyrhizobium quebecense]UGY00975.1 LysR substrate-binding domain-containing protein [Bradyrhizobium quebecense]
MSLTFRQVRHFIATAESGRVSAAAAALNVTQSAVTSSIKALEAELGRKLFDRHSNGVTLTFDGHEFLQRARAIEASVSDATRGPHRWGTQVDGTVDVAVSYTVAGYFLPPLLTRFWRSFPGITVRLHEFQRDAIEQSLISGSVDAAIMLIANLHDRHSIRSRLLLRSARRLWTCVNHPLLRKDNIKLTDLASEPYLMLTVDEAERSAMRYWQHTAHVPNVIFRTLSVEAVRSMVATGMGITILSDMVYRPWSLEGHRIELKTLDDDVHTMDVGLAWKGNATLSPAARAFCEFVAHSYPGSEPFKLD